MSITHIVVDGSNVATESRVLPSLAQLDEAVAELRAEFPDKEVIVVVDATFGHRIDESELAAFDAGQAKGTYLSPPAGAVGRGDAFLLRIAEKVGATVLSNDSFQEFHGEHEWLFDDGRLLGGKPVPGIGWIFTPRTPVRGPRSRAALRDAKSKTKVEKAIKAATKEAEHPEAASSGSRRRKRGSGPPPQAVNDPMPFVTFVAEHRLGTKIEGVVHSFTSHGAFVEADGALCYLPLSAMGDPAPSSAKQMFRRGQVATFVIQAFDAQRRGIELALPGFASPTGAPSSETVRAEIGSLARKAAPVSKKRGAAKKAPARRSAAAPKKKPAPAKKKVAPPTKKIAAKKKSAPAKKKSAPAKKAAPVKKKAAPVKKKAAPVKKKAAPVKKKAAAKKAAAKKATPTRTGRKRR